MNNVHLMVLESEKTQAEIRLKDQIRSIRNTLDNLESKLESGDLLYESDGLQGNGVYIDSYLNKLVAYQRSIEQFKLHLDKSETLVK